MGSKALKLDLVDVFGAGPLRGNPLGVVHGGEGLEPAAMLAITQWLGFSETTFLLSPTDPDADYRVRIFCLARELDFAGHPTLGSCRAWLAAGGTPKRPGVIVQECGVGPVEVRQEGGRLAFRAPPLIRSGPLDPDERAEAIELAGVDPAAVVEAVHVANGPNWRLLRLRSDGDVLAARPQARGPAGTDIGLAGPCAAGGAIDWELRAVFANQRGEMVEDPVTGSFNAGLAMHLFGEGLAKGRYVAAQGRMVGADGRVHCAIGADGSVWIGGRADMIASGARLGVFGAGA